MKSHRIIKDMPDLIGQHYASQSHERFFWFPGTPLNIPKEPTPSLMTLDVDEIHLKIFTVEEIVMERSLSRMEIRKKLQDMNPRRRLLSYIPKTGEARVQRIGVLRAEV